MDILNRFGAQGVLALSVIVFSGCGGGSGGTSTASAEDNPTSPPVVVAPEPEPEVITPPQENEPDPIVPDTPISDIPISEVPIPQIPITSETPVEVIPLENPTPPSKQVNDVNLTTIEVSAINTEDDSNGNLAISWSPTLAENYRVLFWPNDGQVYQVTSTESNAIITASVRNNGGIFVIEAIDALGNSIFSTPTSVEAR